MPEPPESPTVVHLQAPPLTAEAIRTHAKLLEKYPFHFPDEISLAGIEEYIERVTADGGDHDSGLPLYFDPLGLRDADQAMGSTVSIAFKKPVRLGAALRLILDQVGLAFDVTAEGIVFITARSNEGLPADPQARVLKELSTLRTEVYALRADLARHRGQEQPGPAGPASVVPGGLGRGLGCNFR